MFSKLGDGSGLVGWGGLAGVAAGAVFVAASVVNLISPYQWGVSDSFSDYLYQLLLIAAFTLTLGAIAGLHALQRGRYGGWGAAGALIASAGYAVVAVVAAASVVAGAAVLQPLRLGAAAAVLVGSILLGATIIRARVMPWWCGVLIIVGFPLGDFSNAVVRGGEAIVLGIVWGLVGYALLSASGAVARPVAERPSRVS